MGTPIKILIVEDSLDDAAMLVDELKTAGFEPVWKRVETKADFLAELKKSPDIILSDYRMPQFTGLKAAQLVQESGLDIPFILISGTVGEDAAVEAMKFGATDYLLKDRLGRLGSAVKRALEQKHLRDKNRHAEQQIRLQASVLEAAANAILITDSKGRILSANHAFHVLTGYAPAEALGKNPRFLKSGQHDEFFYRQLWETVAGGKFWQGEIINRRKDGTLYCEDMTVTPVSADGIGITHFIAIKQDVTERKRAQEELILKTAFLEAQIESALDAILVVNERAKIILKNQRLFQLFKVPDHLTHEDDDTKLLEYVTSRMKDPKQFGERVAYLYAHPDEVGRDEIALADGTILDRYSAPVRDKAGKYYGRIWTFRDITEQRKLEEQFRQSQKMEGIGQLAGGVAHDFNNILAVIQMQATLVGAGDNLSKEQLEYVEDISSAVQRAAALTRQLLLFSRRQVMQTRDLNLGESITNMTRMLHRVLGEDIQMQFKLAPQSLFIHADAGMMDQVLMNLAVNSRDAMPKGGQIIIETSAVEFDETSASLSARAQPGSFACLSVTDTGTGISPEHLSRIFEPFFTTKDVGKGTGLGLATVFGIVQQHQGWINVYSEIGRGTTFRIYLPRQGKKSEPKSQWPDFAALRGGKETILLVEDDATLRASVAKALSRLGYHVLEVPNAVAALEVWKPHQNEIRLLLTDMVMPGGMTGKELGERLLKENPKLKVVYTSGYSAEVAGKDFPLEEGVNFLTKPFEAHKLAQTIRAALDV